MTLFSDRPLIAPESDENRFRSSIEWMVYLHLGAGFIVIGMFLWPGNPIDTFRGGITSVIHFLVTTGLIFVLSRVRRHDAEHPGVLLPRLLAPAGVLLVHVSAYQGIATWGMSESLGFIIVPVIAVYTRLCLDQRRAFLYTAMFLSVCATIYALLHFGMLPWAWAYKHGMEPPPPRPAMFALEIFIVFGLTCFIYFWVDRLSQTVLAESNRARSLYETTRAFFDASPDGILVLDAAGIVLESNAKAAKLLNRQGEGELTGQPLLQFIPGEFRPVLWDLENRRPKPMPRFERLSLVPAGTSRLLQVEARVVELEEDHGSRSRYLITIRDRQDEEKLKAQLEKAQRLDSLGALAGGVAHDLNNALNPILGFSSLELQTPGLPDETRLSLELIRDCASRATSLSKQLLSLSRGGAPEVRWIDATDIARNIVSVIDRATPPGIDVSFDNPAQHIEIEFSAAQMEQILLNLITNAVEAIGEKGLVRVELSLLEGDRLRDELLGWESDTALLVEITDSGCGIPEDGLKQIFDPFYTTKESRRGTGLGLSVVDRIVTDSRGLVRVESRPGVGSVFRVYLPNARYLRSSPVSDAAVPPAVRGRPLSILAVDDEPTNLVLVQKIAERLGDRVRTANSCAEARAFAESTAEKFDLVLMDLLLPDGNGAELYDEIRRRLGNPRVIFLSGYSRESIPKHLIDSGQFEAFFPKPIDVAQLSESIEQCRGRV